MQIQTKYRLLKKLYHSFIADDNKTGNNLKIIAKPLYWDTMVEQLGDKDGIAHSCLGSDDFGPISVETKGNELNLDENVENLDDN
ncbi:hypothetical protein HK096_002173, partial [Nowakowskiella sp. JEL0078]